MTAFTVPAALSKAQRDREAQRAHKAALVTKARAKLQTSVLDVSWPITDPEMALETLKAEALSELGVLLEHNRLTPTGHPQFTILHGAEPRLCLKQNVRHL